MVMIKSLSIRGYRGFSTYEVGPLAAVNLFVGRNNVGKTSLLEAVQILRSPLPLSALRTIAGRRRETSARVFDGAPRYAEEQVDLSHAFHGHQAELGQLMQLEGTGYGKVDFHVSQVDEKQPSLDDFGPENSQTLMILAAKNAEVIERALITDGGVMLDDARRRVRTLRTVGDGGVFIAPDSISSRELVALYNEVIVSASERGLVDAMKLLDPKVTGVFFLASDRGGIDGSGGILLGRNGKERYPIGSFGDGMRRLLALAMAFVNARGGALYVDEIDTGLHYSVMADLWKLVLGSTLQLKIQAFATTHSLDCIKGLQIALSEEPAMAKRVAVHKVDGRLDKAITFTGDKLLLALEEDLELR